MWDFSPFDWGLLGFTGLVAILGIYYAVNSAKAIIGRKWRNTKKN